MESYIVHGHETRQYYDKIDALHNLCFHLNKTINMPLFKKLLNDPDVINSARNTALHILCRMDKPNLDHVSMLIDVGVDVNIQNNVGKTPLTSISRPPDLSLVQLLLNAGADINIHDKYGFTLLYYTYLCCRDYEKLTSLIKLGSKPDLLHIVNYGLHTYPAFNISRIDYFIKNGLDINAIDTNGDTALHICCRLIKCDSDAQLISKLIKCNADVNIKNLDGQIPLHIMYDTICICDQFDLCRENKLFDKLLAKTNLNIIDRNGCTILHNVLLDVKTNDIRRKTHFCRIRYNCDNTERRVKKILKYNIDCDIKNLNGQTPLHIVYNSIKKYDSNLLKRLYNILITKVNINIPDDNGHTILHHVLMDMQQDMYYIELDTLLKNDASINYVSNARSILMELVEKIDSYAQTSDKATVKRKNALDTLLSQCPNQTKRAVQKNVAYKDYNA
jgi:ankyrin repeat protein